MKNIPVKFRAIASENFADVHAGDTVYGGINASSTEIIDSNGVPYEVNPDSVAQFVGYDADGNEVWTDDLLKDNRGNYFCIQFLPAAVNESTSSKLSRLHKF